MRGAAGCPNAAGGLGHGGAIKHGSDKTNLKIYQDGTLVKTHDWLSTSIANLPTTTSTYTFDLSAERDADIYRLSTRVHSVWQVKSAPADPARIDQMAVLQLDYNIDTDLAGDARGGSQSLRVTPGHLPNAVGAGKIEGTTLSVSYDDGATWKPAQLRQDGTSGAWTASYDAPHHGYVSLKAEAWDDAGNRVSQEVIRAYGLK
ncbi:hypothetical protein ACWD6R_26550 [Streptomyces sp. NPDC005151]